MEHEDTILGDLPWAPESILPAQWKSFHNADRMSPEQELICEVIFDAFDIVKERPTSHREAQLHAETMEWLLSPAETVMSFRWCAYHVLATDPDLIQDALRRGVVIRLSRRARIRGTNTHVVDAHKPHRAQAMAK